MRTTHKPPVVHRTVIRVGKRTREVRCSSGRDYMFIDTNVWYIWDTEHTVRLYSHELCGDGGTGKLILPRKYLRCDAVSCTDQKVYK